MTYDNVVRTGAGKLWFFDKLVSRGAETGEDERLVRSPSND